jgi:ABC-type polysaccharide/polyol phosphate transport system ATPase subunit
MNETLIDVEHVSKQFVINPGSTYSLKGMLMFWRKTPVIVRQVLKDVSFKVGRGESLALVGRNGAGKSTLLSIIARVYVPTTGRCDLNGRIAPLLELGAGFHPDLTGIDNLRMNAMLFGLTAQQVREREDSIIEFSELRDYIKEPVRKYSSGMIAKLGFSIVTHVDADVLIVDEALSVGDFKFRMKCEEFLREYQRQGGTLLFVSHEEGLVTGLAQRAIWLKDGLVAADGPSDEVMQRYHSEG